MLSLELINQKLDSLGESQGKLLAAIDAQHAALEKKLETIETVCDAIRVELNDARDFLNLEIPHCVNTKLDASLKGVTDLVSGSIKAPARDRGDTERCSGRAGHEEHENRASRKPRKVRGGPKTDLRKDLLDKPSHRATRASAPRKARKG